MAEKVEEWRPIPGYEGAYEASSLGRIRSHRPCRGLPVPHVMTAGVDALGYRFVTLTHPRRRRWPVHRLVLAAFVGDRPWPEWSAAHNNGIPGDNRLSNLRWATHTENMHDKYAHGTNAHGSRHGMAKLTERAVLEIRQRVASGEPQKNLAAEFGVTKARISEVVNKKAWTHVP